MSRTRPQLAGTTTEPTEWSGSDAYGEVVVVVEAEHNGHKIVARSQPVVRTLRPGTADESVHPYTLGEVEVDGAYYMTLPTGTPAQVARKVIAKLDTDAADAQIVGQLNRLVAAVKRADALAPAGEVEVGTVAYVHAMGYMRRGIVTRLTKTGAEVAYTTASSAGRVFRKVAKLDELRVDATDAPVVEAPVVVEAAPVVVAAEAARDEVTATVEPATDAAQLARTVEAAEGDLLAATEAEQLAKAGDDKREAHLSSRRRRAAGRRLARAQAALAAAQG